MSVETPIESKYRWVADKFGLFLVPIISYYLVFVYEAGYCRCFGISQTFIRPDITTILVFASAVFGTGTILVMIVDSWIDYVKGAPLANPTAYVARLYAPFAFIMLFAMFLYGTHKLRWFFFVLPILAGTFADLLSARFLGDKKKSYWMRLQGPLLVFCTPGSVWEIARKRLSAEVLLAIVGIYFARIVASSIGEAEALNQRVYLVPSSHPDTVVVRVYGDKIFCVRVDLKLKKPTKEVFILSAGADSTLHLDNKEIGPLVFE